MSAENVITDRMATSSGAGTVQIRAEMQQIINENGTIHFNAWIKNWKQGWMSNCHGSNED
jgi:hypothetical protein